MKNPPKKIWSRLRKEKPHECRSRALYSAIKTDGLRWLVQTKAAMQTLIDVKPRMNQLDDVESDNRKIGEKNEI